MMLVASMKSGDNATAIDENGSGHNFSGASGSMKDRAAAPWNR
jgi:hypothetical protein